MPMYAYRCTACGHAFDIHQSFSEDSLTVCPTCEGTLRKVFGTVGVTFNGSGFYRTDSRAPASTEKGSAGKTAATPSSAQGATSTPSSSSSSSSSGASSSSE